MLRDQILRSVALPSINPAQVTRGEDSTVTKKVQYYREWLANDAVRNRIANSGERIDEYEHTVALSSTIVNGQEIVTFAPFQQHLSALQTTTPTKRRIL